MSTQPRANARRTAAYIALGILSLVAPACTTRAADDPMAEHAPAPKDDGFVAHLEPAPAIRFPIPKAGMKLEVAAFDATLGAEKFRHELRLLTDSGDIHGMIHVWDNPLHLDVRTWFDANLSGFIGEATSVRDRTAGKARLAAIELDEPASEDAFSQSMVVFATRSHVYLVTAIDPEQIPAAKKLFEKVVDGFEPEVGGIDSTKAPQNRGTK